jgi:hypothetical protein
MIRLIIGALVVGMATNPVQAQGYHFNQGYFRNDGTYVQPHFQTNPNGNPYDNWSTRGNINPFTGQPGTHNPYPTSRGW